MSRNTDTLFELIDIWAKEQQIYSKQGTVKSVDTDAKTCVVTPSDGGPEILDVRLESDEDTSNKGFFIVPAVNSLVIVSFMSPQESFISCWTSIDEIIAIQGQWTFNSGDNGGLVKVDDLTQKLNKLVTEVNALKDIFNNHIHTTTATVGPTAVPGVIAPTTTTANDASRFTKGDFENEDVVH